MDTPQRWILRNIARRPVELHGAAGVEIIPPDGSIEVETIDPQCAALVGRGLLTQHEAPPEQGDESAAETAPAKPRRRAAAKRGGSKTDKKDSPRPRAKAAKGDQAPATGLRKGEGE